MSEWSRGARGWHAVWLFLALLILGLVATLITHDVSTEVTPDDAAYAERFLRETGHGDLIGQTPPADFDDQVNTILAVQDAVLSIASENEGIPFDKTRELRDLYEARAGLCFDRSRAIEKILTHMGFEARHAAVYSTEETGSALASLLTPKTPSHAVTEVKTQRGWLVVDSNRRWIGLTRGGAALDLAKLQAVEAGNQAWDPRVQEPMNRILRGPFTYVLGLYSRHGRFYPPYTPVPDVDWSQIPDNVGG